MSFQALALPLWITHVPLGPLWITQRCACPLCTAHRTAGNARHGKAAAPRRDTAAQASEPISGLGTLAHGRDAQGNNLASHLAGTLSGHRPGREENATVVLELLDGLQDVGERTVAAVLLGR